MCVPPNKNKRIPCAMHGFFHGLNAPVFPSDVRIWTSEPAVQRQSIHPPPNPHSNHPLPNTNITCMEMRWAMGCHEFETRLQSSRTCSRVKDEEETPREVVGR